MSEAATLHKKMFELIQKHDLDGVAALLHRDYSYMGGDGEERKGTEVALEVAQTYITAFPDLALETRHEYTWGDDVSILELTARGTHQAELQGMPATHRKVELPVCNIVELRDGKILREREYFDNGAILAQLGVSPGTPE